VVIVGEASGDKSIETTAALTKRHQRRGRWIWQAMEQSVPQARLKLAVLLEDRVRKAAMGTGRDQFAVVGGHPVTRSLKPKTDMNMPSSVEKAERASKSWEATLAATSWATM